MFIGLSKIESISFLIYKTESNRQFELQFIRFMSFIAYPYRSSSSKRQSYSLFVKTKLLIDLIVIILFSCILLYVLFYFILFLPVKLFLTDWYHRAGKITFISRCKIERYVNSMIITKIPLITKISPAIPNRTWWREAAPTIPNGCIWLNKNIMISIQQQ